MLGILIIKALNRGICSITATLLAAILPLSAQIVTYDVGFETFFDNREYSETENGSSNSGSDFAARIAPTVGLDLGYGNALKIGIDATQPFGVESDSFFNDVNLMLYYEYDSDKLKATAGLFPRSKMNLDDYSTAFFATDYLFYNNIVSGIMGRYEKGESFVEFICDWESQPTSTTREKFRLVSAGKYSPSRFYAGYNLSITHFAGQDGGLFTNVVDNILFNPNIGFKTSAGLYDIDVKVSLLQSLQRDRSYENEWLAPRMGEVAMKIGRNGFILDERFYFGDDLFPLYGGHTLDDGTYMAYGKELYTGDIFFRTSKGFYNRAALSYCKSFFDDLLDLKVHFVTHCDGSGLGTEQIIELKLKIGGTLYNSDKHK